MALCKHLKNFVDSDAQHVSVNASLLKRVQRAVLNCDGFNESQKDDFAFLFNMSSIEAGLPPHADHWSVFKAISAKRGWAMDVIFVSCQIVLPILHRLTQISTILLCCEKPPHHLRLFRWQSNRQRGNSWLR